MSTGATCIYALTFAHDMSIHCAFILLQSYCDQLYCWCCFGRVHPQGFSAVSTDQVGVEFVTLFSQSVMALAVTRGLFL
uniref:Uncharacterized protein n=2 Tax=Oryza rufipogon TaxID=4529 RepID=A0A0E0NJC1_ORYRU